MLRCDLIIGKLVVILCCWVLLGVIELLFRSRWESNPSSCSDTIEISCVFVARSTGHVWGFV